MYKNPYHIVNGIKTHIPGNDIMYIIDLFIYTNNLKLLFDIIQRVINDKNETLSEEGIIDIITEECKLENKLTTFFNRKDTNKIYMKYICNILFLIKESIQGIKLYDFNNVKMTDTGKLPLYIIGDYILHRIKNIKDKINKKVLFTKFCIYSSRPISPSKDKFYKMIKTYLDIQMIDYLPVKYTSEDKTPHTYVNMVETTILNIFLLFFYNKDSDRIKVNLKSFNDSKNNKVKNFFNKYTYLRIQEESYKILSKWGQLLANRRDISYVKSYSDEKYEVSGISIYDLFIQIIDPNIQISPLSDMKDVYENMVKLLQNFAGMFREKIIIITRQDNEQIKITFDEDEYVL